jgi:hypothetical protein
MTRTLFLAALVAVACGDVRERRDCKSSTSCAPGEYCAHTGEGRVCWPDPVAPAVATVSVDCGGDPCPRDGALLVTAEVSDDREVLAVEATVDVDPDHPVALLRGAGSTWTGAVDLAARAFPALETEVTVTVRALDGARNEAVLDGAPLRVSRVRWEKALDSSVVIPTPPAVGVDGTAIVGGSDGKLRFFASDGSAAHLPLTLAGSAIAHAPSIGAQAIWVGANDGKLYAVKLDGSGELSARTCTGSGVAKGPPAVLTTSGVDVAFGAFSNGRIYASGPTCVPTSAGDPWSSGTAIGGDGAVYATSSTALAKALRRVTWDGEALGASWSIDLGDTVSAPLAFASASGIISGSIGGDLERTSAGTSSGSISTITGLSSSIDDSPIVLANGDIVVGDASGKLHRLSADGTAVWDPPVDLGAAVHAPMALAGGPVRFLVATFDGKVHALDDDGAILWAGALTSGVPLGAGNLYTPSGSGFSTAYFAGADGKLYAVAVEGRLDTDAPWPKAWHDLRNTSRAGGAF